MDNKLYKELDNVFLENVKMSKYAEKNIKFLKENANQLAVKKKYSIDSKYGGNFCPSLIFDKINCGYSHKRRCLLNDVPKVKNDYSMYEIDDNNKLLRINEIDSFGTTEYYNIITDNIEYCISIFEEKKCPWGYNTRTTYFNGKVKQFNLITSEAALWSEHYEYTQDKIICKLYYYTPGLKDADKLKPIGENGCSIQLYIINFKMDKNNEVYWLEQGEYIRGKLWVFYKYEK